MEPGPTGRAGVALLREITVEAVVLVHELHELRREERDEDEEDGVEEQVGEVEVLAVRVPLHLQVLLGERVRQQLHPSVHHHRLQQPQR